MNERIKLLAKTYLSHERFGPYGESTIEDYYEFYPEELEYFVGLIVRECIGMVLPYNEDDPSAEKLYELADAIGEHFGVEE